jgi:protein-tyrosine phosphatase
MPVGETTRQDAVRREMKKKRILFVCLGNICRSPTAEGVLRAIAAREFPELPLTVDSAGTANYHVGEPPDRRTVAAARRRGYDLSAQRARQVAADDFDRFDYLLAMDRANLAELERRRPRNAAAQAGLFLAFAPDSGFVEVPDPYHGGVEDFERVLELCEAGARGLLTKLANDG